MDSSVFVIAVSRGLSYPRGVHNIGLLVKGTCVLRALRQSALPRLMRTSASQAVSQARVGGSRSNLLCHHAGIRLASSGRNLSRRNDSTSEYLILYSIRLLAAEEHPHNAGGLGGERHGGLVLPAAFDAASYPLAAAIRLEPYPPEGGPGAVDEERPQRAIATLPDPEQARRAPSGGLPGHAPPPHAAH